MGRRVALAAGAEKRDAQAARDARFASGVRDTRTNVVASRAGHTCMSAMRLAWKGAMRVLQVLSAIHVLMSLYRVLATPAWARCAWRGEARCA